MATNDGDDDGRGEAKILVELSNKGRCTDDIERSDTKQPMEKSEIITGICIATLLCRIEDTVLLEHLSDDRDGGVHGVRDDEHECLRARSCDTGSQIANDTSIDLRSNKNMSSIRRAGSAEP